MSPKISVLIRKNSHEVIRLITRSVQSDHRYCHYNNEGADEMILPLFPAFLLLRIVVAAFSTRSLKTCSIMSEYAESFMSTRRSCFSGLEEHSRTIHHTLHTIYVFTIRK
jgi:hypothetical protein